MYNPNDCYFFHDVDTIPESGILTYCCSPNSVIHYASARSTREFTMGYEGYFGGVVAATASQFRRANGFSNGFWGWGAEDDEFRERVLASGQRISRIPLAEGRYLVFDHSRDKSNYNERLKKVKEVSKVWKQDGLNSAKYSVDAILDKTYYTEIQVRFY
uniref:Galactosyltransferase C-terminal domain-containing protein n=1 Tax=Plectus sambesii TaxID=2011161 RepID=A0A914V7I7_9BILA